MWVGGGKGADRKHIFSLFNFKMDRMRQNCIWSNYYFLRDIKEKSRFIKRKTKLNLSIKSSSILYSERISFKGESYFLLFKIYWLHYGFLTFEKDLLSLFTNMYPFKLVPDCFAGLSVKQEPIFDWWDPIFPVPLSSPPRGEIYGPGCRTIRCGDQPACPSWKQHVGQIIRKGFRFVWTII